jgi:energy-coupling factor transporter ATP-binding protein EcfA2
MLIKRYHYSERVPTGRGWEIDSIDFPRVSFVAGRNASGKSRLLSTISSLAQQIRKGGQINKLAGEFDVLFSDNDDKYEYVLKYYESKVFEEKLVKNGRTLLNRGEGGRGTIFAEAENKDIAFQCPVGEIAAAARQDEVQHPFLIPLNKWAESLYYYKFGTDLGRNSLIVATGDSVIPLDPYDQDQVANVFRTAELEFHAQFVDALLEDIREVGFAVTAVSINVPYGVKISSPFGASLKCLEIAEEGVDNPIPQILLSQGMFRSIAILIHLRYALLSRRAQTIVIDDIGEGLDFERSCKLIERVVSLANASSSQLIMSSNDRFVMNSVPLDSWIVLRRAGTHVKVISENTDPQLFRDFQYSGLSNFDFFRGVSGGDSGIGDPE